jgi:hypothetical protein
MPTVLVRSIANSLKITREESQRFYLISKWLHDPFTGKPAVQPQKNSERIVLRMGPRFSRLLQGGTVEADMRAGHGIGALDSPLDDVLKPVTVPGKELHQGGHGLRSGTHATRDIQGVTDMDIVPDPDMLVSALAG